MALQRPVCQISTPCPASSVILEPTDSASFKTLRQQTNLIPILRLYVEPVTNEVHVSNDSNSIHNYEKSTPANQRCHVTLNSNKADASVDRGTYYEEWKETEDGIAWGKKKAHDNSWNEQWIQQEIRPLKKHDNVPPPVLKLYGRRCGENKLLKQRWTEKWEKDDAKLIITLSVEEYEEKDNQNIVQKWTEISEKDLKTGFTIIKKVGEDSINGPTLRQWTSEETHEDDGNCMEKKYCQYDGRCIHGTNELIAKDGVKVKSQWYKAESITDGQNEEWEDKVYELQDGTRFGTKSGINTHGENWSENWESEGATKVIQKSWTSKDQDIVRNEIVKYSDKNDLQSIQKEEILHGENNSINTCETIEYVPGGTKGDIIKTETIHVPELPSQLAESKKKVECWSDINSKKENRSVEVTKIYDKNSSTPRVLRLVQVGKNTGYDPKNTICWEDNWTEEFEHASNKDDETESDGNLKKTQHSYNKWWREDSGNSWGEKRTLDANLQEEHNEKWYDNGSERQVDRWICKADGSESGEKFGSHSGGTTWNEVWNKNLESGISIDKWWKTQSHDQIHEWGEKEGKEHSKSWTGCWHKIYSSNSYEEYNENSTTDKKGVTNVEKTGRSASIINGTEFETNWFHEKFGEDSNCQSSWATKQGRNSSGDNWYEKWYQDLKAKEAVKSGSNSHGDIWGESWYEELSDMNIKSTWARKTGQNAQGDEWEETWKENGNSKYAKKTGKNIHGEKWEERWGEEQSEDGSGQKWTSKWANNDRSDIKSGNNWGDSWGPGGIGGHRWGEIWDDKGVHKWSYDTAGRPEGC